MALLLVGLGAWQSPASASGPAPDKLQELVNRSPFENTAKKPASAASDHQPLEFRGVLEERGHRIFSIYDTVTRRSTWLDLKRPAAGIKIEAYDDAQQSITVMHHGNSLSLPLKGARPIIPMDEPASAQAAKGKETNDYHDKPFRIGHVLEETLIRRAMRRPAATSASSPVPPTTAISR